MKNLVIYLLGSVRRAYAEAATGGVLQKRCSWKVAKGGFL